MVGLNSEEKRTISDSIRRLAIPDSDSVIEVLLCAIERSDVSISSFQIGRTLTESFRVPFTLELDLTQEYRWSLPTECEWEIATKYFDMTRTAGTTEWCLDEFSRIVGPSENWKDPLFQNRLTKSVANQDVRHVLRYGDQEHYWSSCRYSGAVDDSPFVRTSFRPVRRACDLNVVMCNKWWQ